MSSLPVDGELLVLGLGAPHDELVAAACTPYARGARSAGPLDAAAEARGREALPRGACAPLLYTTGALLRETARTAKSAQLSSGAPAEYAVLSIGSCGPCRYALFESAWQRALRLAGRAPVRVVALPQSGAAFHAWFDTPIGVRLLEAVAVADALVLSRNRALPRALRPVEREREFERVTTRVRRAIVDGAAPLDALEAVRGWDRASRRPTSQTVARVQLLGDPWSLHTNGEGQLRLPSVLAPLGVEVMAPPSLLWARYSLWLAHAAPWGGQLPAAGQELAALRARDERVVMLWQRACAALAIAPGDLPDPAWLAQLASPYLPPTLRGGYGHMELGLARAAVLSGSAHALISVKSFGCLPSSGVSDAIIGAALNDVLPCLSLEVCADGHAARESRLALLAAEALRRAASEAKRPSHGSLQEWSPNKRTD